MDTSSTGETTPTPTPTPLSNNYSALTAGLPAVLQEQQKMKNVLSGELGYVYRKGRQNQAEVLTENRNVFMAENLRKRRRQYIRILVIWVGAFVIIFCLFFVAQRFPRIPYKIILMFILFISLIWSVNIYYDLLNRNPLNYDELIFVPPNSTTGSITKALGVRDPSGRFTVGLCIDDSCCGSGTVFDKATSTCVLPLPTPSPSGTVQQYPA